MNTGCLDGAASVAPTLPFQLERPTDGALLADVAILLATIAALYFAFKAISRHPWIPTSIALAVLLYAGLDRTWWNTARVEVDEAGVRQVPWMGWTGDERFMAWGEVAGFTCEGGALFPVVSDDTRVVLHGRDNVSKIEIPRYLDPFPDFARVVADRVRPLAAP